MFTTVIRRVAPVVARRAAPAGARLAVVRPVVRVCVGVGEISVVVCVCVCVAVGVCVRVPGGAWAAGAPRGAAGAAGWAHPAPSGRGGCRVGRASMCWGGVQLLTTLGTTWRLVSHP